MYQYIVYYDYKKDDGIWEYNKIYKTNFDSKNSHDRAARELESYIGSFNNFKITKVLCD